MRIRSFDWLFGDLSYSTDIDNLRNLNATFCNPVNINRIVYLLPDITTSQANVTTPKGTQLCATPSAGNVSPEDPNHSVTGVTFQIFGTFHPNETVTSAQILSAETMLGFVQEEATVLKSTNLTLAGEALNYIPESLIPVYSAMAENYVIFDRWFADVPGPTDPNRYISRACTITFNAYF